MSVPDDAGCGFRGAPPRRPAASLSALALVATVTALVGCEGAEPYYRHATLGGASGGAMAGGDGGLPAAADARSDRAGGDDGPSANEQPLAEVGGGDTAAEPDAADADASCETCALGVLYWCEGTSANTIRATFSLVNDTPEPIPLREVTIRYWFTGAGGSPWQFACDNGMLGEEPSNVDVTAAVSGTFHPVMPPRPGADMYFEVAFSAAADNLLTRQPSLFRTRVFRQDYSTIIQTDDYSFNVKNTSFAPSPHVTLYRNGMLIEGIEPTTQ